MLTASFSLAAERFQGNCVRHALKPGRYDVLVGEYSPDAASSFELYRLRAAR